MTAPKHVLEAVDAILVARPAGWRSAGDEVALLTRPGHLYRGMTEEEYDAHVASGMIKSTGRYSYPSEGTCFADSAEVAESYANFGRDDPRKTGRPSYLVEIPDDPAFGMTRWPDGYYKTPLGVPLARATRIWRMAAENDAIVGRRIR